MPRSNRAVSRHAVHPRVESMEERALLSTLTVTDLGDSGPGTLRNAIEQANLDPSPDAITFAPGLKGAIGLLSPLPDLTGTLTLLGTGASDLAVVRDPSVADTGFRIFTIAPGATVGLANLIIAGGGGVAQGGGISNAGTLTVVRCTIQGNALERFQTQEHARAGIMPAGGGIYNSGTLGLVDSLVAGNTANTVAFDAPAFLPAPLNSGGGIANTGTAVIVGSTIAANHAYLLGGGLSNTGTLTLLNSTVSNNSVGFATSHLSPGSGGGIANQGSLTTVFTTITANTADYSGGGLYNFNTSSPPTLLDTIVAGNLKTPPGPPVLPARSDDIVTDTPIPAILAPRSHNLIGTARNQQGRFLRRPPASFQPRLGPLSGNGGSTPTIPLLPHSPAINTGLSVPDVTTDQRGFPRPRGRAPDIGAFEV